jgi:hypothetical protein
MTCIRIVVGALLAAGDSPQQVFVSEILHSPLFESAMENQLNPLPIDERALDGAPDTPHTTVESLRFNLCELLETIVLAQPSVCNEEYLPTFLTAYTASVAPSDQALLRIMKLHEVQGAELGLAAQEWGPESIDWQERAKYQAGLTSPGIASVVASIKPPRVKWTMENFSRIASTVGPGAPQPMSLQEQVAAYDPAFLLLVLASALAEPTVSGPDLRLLIETGLFGYLMMSLSLEDDGLRRIGYAASFPLAPLTTRAL